MVFRCRTQATDFVWRDKINIRRGNDPTNELTKVLSISVDRPHDRDYLLAGRKVHEFGMELFSRRRWTTGSAKQSNMYGIMPCMCCIIFWVCHKHNRLPLEPIQPSSPSTKQLHGLGDPITATRRGLQI